MAAVNNLKILFFGSDCFSVKCMDAIMRSPKLINRLALVCPENMPFNQSYK